MWQSRPSPVSLPFLPNLLEIEFLGLSFDNPEGLEVDVKLVLGEDLGGDWELGFLLESFCSGPKYFPSFGFYTIFFFLHPIDVIGILGF